MQSFTFIDIILFLGISQGVFLAVTIQIIKDKNKEANTILSIILLLSVVMLSGRMIFFRFLTPRFLQWTILIDAVIFLFGPLCYMYFRRLSFYKNEGFRLSWQHYIPVMFHVLFSFYTLYFTPVEFMDKISSGFFQIPFAIIEGAGIVSNFYYWGANNKLLKAYTKEEKNVISYKQRLVSFFSLFQIFILIFILVWMISFLSRNFFNYIIPFISYDIVWAVISVFIYVIGYYSLKEPVLFRIPLQKEKTNVQTRITQTQTAALEKELDYLMEKEKMFLKPDLTLGELSEKLNTSTHNVSWYLNNVLNSNFYDYINRYRVQEFLTRIENNQHYNHTIFAISLDVGFNSKSTFNKAFKQEMKDTPTNYIKQVNYLGASPRGIQRKHDLNISRQASEN